MNREIGEALHGRLIVEDLVQPASRSLMDHIVLCVLASSKVIVSDFVVFLFLASLRPFPQQTRTGC